MKVLHVTYSLDGGAGIACKRLHEALLKSGADSYVIVARPGARTTEHIIVAFGGIRLFANRVINSALCRINNRLLDGQPRSISVFKTGLHREINSLKPDIVHLHWPCAELIAIEEIAKIDAPIVWTLHDMWAFCGAEHYTMDRRYETGYNKRPFSSRHEVGGELLTPKELGSSCEGQHDIGNSSRKNARPRMQALIDRWIFRRKFRYWQKFDLDIVTPSHWLAGCARESVLLKNLRFETIPNCLDLSVFKPRNREASRKEFGLSQDCKIILFGALSFDDPRKGGDLLEVALSLLSKTISRHDLLLVVFGGGKQIVFSGLPVKFIGDISCEDEMASLYNASDVFVAPSRQDNLPNTCVEAHSCGVPVVAFDVGGLSDIVINRATGYLAKPNDPADLKAGIEFILGLPKDEYDMMCENARAKAERDFAESRVADQYVDVYQSMLGKQSHSYSGSSN